MVKDNNLTATSDLRLELIDELQANQEVDTSTELKAITQAAAEAKIKNKLGLSSITPKTKQLINTKINSAYDNTSVTNLDNQMNRSVTVRMDC